MPVKSALAHEGEPLAPHDLWSTWNWDPGILLLLAVSGWLYLRGTRTLWQKAGMRRGISFWNMTAFLGGLAALAAALISPIDALGSSLFSAHMIQHLLLILVAAPLLVLGAPSTALVWSLPGLWRPALGRWWVSQRGLRNIWHLLTRPILVWMIHAAAIIIWHVPVFYQAAIKNEFIHIFEHASFFITAILFWWVFMPKTRLRTTHDLQKVLYIFTTALYGGLLAALITFSEQVWYPIYSEATSLWNLTPIEDQQLAGVIMWVPGSVVYLTAVLVLLGRWFLGIEKDEESKLWQSQEMPAKD